MDRRRRQQQPAAPALHAPGPVDLLAAGVTYAEWIASFEQEQLATVKVIGAEHEPPEARLPYVLRGWCRSAVEEMVRAFPELRKARGHYAGREHWWCVAPDGIIWDPTAKQFWIQGAYVEYTGPDPVGKCMNCGDYVWTMEQSGTSAACSPDCLRELEHYYSNP